MANAVECREILVVEEGEVYIYTIIDSKKGYKKENLMDKTLCPRNIINCIPEMILKVCSMFPTPQLLYLKNHKWVSETLD